MSCNSKLENLKKQKELWLDSESLQSIVLYDEYGVKLVPDLSLQDFENLRSFMIDYLSNKISNLK